jgi:hypothetical protein
VEEVDGPRRHAGDRNASASPRVRPPGSDPEPATVNLWQWR